MWFLRVDYLVSTGNYGKIYGHSGDDIGVVIGAYNVMSLGEGNDHGKVFGNKNTVYLVVKHRLTPAQLTLVCLP